MSTEAVEARIAKLEAQMTTLIDSTQDLTRNMASLVSHMDGFTTTLVNVVSNKIPEGSMSLNSHKQIVTSLIWAFTGVIGFIMGVREFVAYMHPG